MQSGVGGTYDMRQITGEVVQMLEGGSTEIPTENEIYSYFRGQLKAQALFSDLFTLYLCPVADIPAQGIAVVDNRLSLGPVASTSAVFNESLFYSPSSPTSVYTDYVSVSEEGKVISISLLPITTWLLDEAQSDLQTYLRKYNHQEDETNAFMSSICMVVHARVFLNGILDSSAYSFPRTLRYKTILQSDDNVTQACSSVEYRAKQQVSTYLMLDSPRVKLLNEEGNPNVINFTLEYEDDQQELGTALGIDMTSDMTQPAQLITLEIQLLFESQS